jgi:hypothetical protein
MGGAGGLTPRLGLTAEEATPAHAAASRSLGDLQGSLLPLFVKVVILPRWGYRFWGLEPASVARSSRPSSTPTSRGITRTPTSRYGVVLRGVCRVCGGVGHRAQGAAFAQVSDLWH